MIRGTILLLLVVVAIEAASIRNSPHFSLWTDFKTTHDKSYETVEEESARFYIYIDNLHQIEKHNKEYEAGRKSYQVAMNKFGDMTKEEFRAGFNGFKRPSTLAAQGPLHVSSVNAIPDAVDWRTKGYVTPVKDQKQCGSCWAFSATGSLEGQHFKKSGKLVSLSEQNLVDCSQAEGNEGCNGGWMDSAFQYITANKGIDTESSYPYEARDRKCRFNKTTIGATDVSFVDIKQGNETDLENAIATVGPVSVAIDASQDSFQFYKTGVYYEPQCSSQELDHGVLAVGYGVTDKGVKYYIVKNSWGASWGDKGFLLMSRERKNNCGIATSASYPVV